MMAEIKQPQSISMAEMQSIVNGNHGDPFKVLGPHPYEDGLVFRLFLPQAAEVDLLIGDETFRMDKVYWDGFFERIIR